MRNHLGVGAVTPAVQFAAELLENHQVITSGKYAGKDRLSARSRIFGQGNRKRFA
jgi:hypothetical protein